MNTRSLDNYEKYPPYRPCVAILFPQENRFLSHLHCTDSGPKGPKYLVHQVPVLQRIESIVQGLGYSGRKHETPEGGPKWKGLCADKRLPQPSPPLKKKSKAKSEIQTLIARTPSKAWLTTTWVVHLVFLASLPSMCSPTLRPKPETLNSVSHTHNPQTHDLKPLSFQP